MTTIKSTVVFLLLGFSFFTHAMEAPLLIAHDLLVEALTSNYDAESDSYTPDFTKFKQAIEQGANVNRPFNVLQGEGEETTQWFPLEFVLEQSSEYEVEHDDYTSVITSDPNWKKIIKVLVEKGAQISREYFEEVVEDERVDEINVLIPSPFRILKNGKILKLVGQDLISKKVAFLLREADEHVDYEMSVEEYAYTEDYKEEIRSKFIRDQLRKAIRTNNKDLYEVALAAGADMFIEDEEQNIYDPLWPEKRPSAFEMVCSQDDESKIIKVIKDRVTAEMSGVTILELNGIADGDNLGIFTQTGSLHMAALNLAGAGHLKALQILIKKGIDINMGVVYHTNWKRNEAGELLSRALNSNQIHVARWLKENGINEQSRSDTAMMCNHVDHKKRLMLDGVNANVFKKIISNCCLNIRVQGNKQFLRWIINRRFFDEAGNEHSQNHHTMIKEVLSFGARLSIETIGLLLPR